MLVPEPPDRVVITWDLNPRWQVETDPEKTSEVEVRFVDSAGGWPLYLRRFADVVRA